MKELVGAFNQEKALVGAFSVIVKSDCETDGSSATLVATAAVSTAVARIALGQLNKHGYSNIQNVKDTASSPL